MAFKKTEVRPYQFLINLPNSFPVLPHLLEGTKNLYNKGAFCFTNVFLNMLAGFHPSLASLPIFESKEDLVSPPIFSFLCWFTLESANVAPKEPELLPDSPEQMLDLFEKYYHSEISGEEWKEVETLARFNFRAGNGKSAIWVNRHRAFREWNKRIGIPQEAIAAFLQNPDLPLHKQGADSQTAFRGLLTAWFGTGKKENSEELMKCCRSWLRLDFDSFVGDSQKEVVTTLLKTVHCDSYEVLNERIGFRGATKGIVNFLKNGTNAEFTEKDAKKQVNNIQKTLAAAQSKGNLNKYNGHPFAKNILAYLEENIGVPYFCKCNSSHQRNDTAHQNQYGEMASLAWEKITSWRSQVINQLAERKSYVAQLKPYSGEFFDVVDNYFIEKWERTQEVEKDAKKPHLESHNLNGLEEALVHLRENNDYEECINRVQDNSEIRVDGNFLKHLAKFLPEFQKNMTDQEILEDLRSLAEYQGIKFKLDTLLMPCFTHISDDNPIHPRFGESRPTGSIDLSDEKFYKKNQAVLERAKKIFDQDSTLSKKYRDLGKENLVLKTEIELYDEKQRKFKIIEIPISSKRAIVELFLKHEGEGVIRNHPLAQMASGVPCGVVQKVKAGFKLIKDEENSFVTGKPRWHLVYSPKFEVPATALFKEIAALPVGTKFLSVNNGVRNPAGYAILTIAEQGIEVKNKENKHICCVNVLETGILTNDDLLGDCGDTPDSMRQLWETYPAQKMGEKFTRGAKLPMWFPDKNVSECMFQLARFARLSCYHMEKVDIEMRNKVLLPIIGLFFNGEREIGALGIKRINSFNELKRACESYLRKCAKEEFKDEKVETFWKSIRKRLLAIKQERARLTANLVIRKAIEHKVEAIIHEDLTNFRMDRGLSKKTNKMLGCWRPQEVLKQITMHAGFHGFLTLATFPGNVSHLDLDGQWKPKFFKINDEEQLDWNFWKNFFMRLTKKVENKKRDKGKYDMCALEFLSEHNIDVHDPIPGLKSLVREKKEVFFPRMDGNYFDSSMLGGIVQSDELAAINLGIRKIRDLSSYTNKKNASGKVAVTH